MGTNARDVGLHIDECHRTDFIKAGTPTDASAFSKDEYISWKVERLGTEPLCRLIDIVEVIVGDQIVGICGKYIFTTRSLDAGIAGKAERAMVNVDDLHILVAAKVERE